MSKVAVVLFNLGGPDALKSVRPFLRNLFSDPAIIALPQPFRAMLAQIISRSRAGKARAIYQQLGGKSPLLEQTQAQAEALEKHLNESGGDEYKVFVCMRYWHPMSQLVAKKVKAWGPDHIIQLPLYPQFSTTTTGSSIDDWGQACKREKMDVEQTSICCYPTAFGLAAAHAKLIREAYWKASEDGKPRILFSAHGLPEKVIEKGDPYQWQIEKTAAAIVQILAIDEIDWRICYQSRVGPMKWIGPSTEEEIHQAGKDGVPLVVVPVAFVSEHSETLVELDIDYRRLADGCGVPGYWRVPALAAEPLFIDMLAELCLGVDRGQKICSSGGQRFCAAGLTRCPCAA